MNTSGEERELIVGLDIGTTKIACFVGRKNDHGKIEIIAVGRHESLGVSRGMVSNLTQTVESIRQAVRKAEDMAQVDIRVVNVGIAGQHIKSIQYPGLLTRQSIDDLISQRDIEKLIDDMHKINMAPGEEIIHVLPQEYIVDGEPGIKDPVGRAGLRLEANFHIITGQVQAIRNIQKCVANAELEIQSLVLEPLASADAVLSQEEKEAGVVLVDIGGGTTDIAVFHEGIIRHTAVIPFGGNVITDDIKQGLNILRQQAELLKVRFGSAFAGENMLNEIVCIPGLRGREPKEISIKNLSSIIQARMEEIIDHVMYEIRSTEYHRDLIGGIVLTGGGSQLKHISQLFEFQTGMDTRIGFPNEHLSVSGDTTELAQPAYSTGIGLVIRGIDKRPVVQPDNGKVRTSSKTRKSLLDNIADLSAKFFNDEVN